MTEPRRDDPNDHGDRPTDENDPGSDDTGRAVRVAAVLGAIFSLGALGLYGTRSAFSVFVGALVAIANLLTMRTVIRALVQVPSDNEPSSNDASTDGAEQPPAETPRGTRRRGSAFWALLAGFKILLLFGGLWLLLTRRLVDPMPLVVGYGVLPLGIAASALWSILETRR